MDGRVRGRMDGRQNESILCELGKKLMLYRSVVFIDHRKLRCLKNEPGAFREKYCISKSRRR